MKTSSQATIIYFNARSVFSKLDAIKFTVNKLCPSFICVTESWLNSSIPTAAIEMDDFLVYRSDSMGANPSGGVLIYIHKSINSSGIKMPTELEAPIGVKFSCITAQIAKYKSFILCTIYNHPPVNLKILQFNFKLFTYLLSLQKTVYVIGDFQYKYVAD